MEAMGPSPNGPGTVDIEDFLSILGVFGDVDTDGDGNWDSTKEECHVKRGFDATRGGLRVW